MQQCCIYLVCKMILRFILCMIMNEHSPNWLHICGYCKLAVFFYNVLLSSSLPSSCILGRILEKIFFFWKLQYVFSQNSIQFIDEENNL